MEIMEDGQGEDCCVESCSWFMPQWWNKGGSTANNRRKAQQHNARKFIDVWWLKWIEMMIEGAVRETVMVTGYIAGVWRHIDSTSRLEYALRQLAEFWTQWLGVLILLVMMYHASVSNRLYLVRIDSWGYRKVMGPTGHSWLALSLEHIDRRADPINWTSS